MAAQPYVTLPMRVTATADGQELTIGGRIDVRTVADVRAMLHAVIDGGSGDLHVHLGDAEIGDATGLGVLLEAHNRSRRAGRRMFLGELTPRTDRLLRASRLNRVLLPRLTLEAGTPQATVGTLTG